jgi:sugar phosphate isomerase/epimerase
MTQYNRREFLGAAALSAAALLAVPATVHASARRKIPIGVQLYSVRTDFNNDVPGTLAGIKKIGYDGVEFAGYAGYGDNAKGLRQLLDDNGLKVCGTHMQGALKDVADDQLDKTIEFNEVIGNNKLIVAMLHGLNTPDDWTKQADVFSGIAEKLKPHNMRIGYHNHLQEFTPLSDGRMPEDVFFDKASLDVFAELDIGHCAHAGADPAAVLKRMGSRIINVHVKDWIPETKGDIVGEGIVKWPGVIDACEADDGLQWYIIEEESRKFPKLDGIARDFDNLTKMLPA